jgi:predicted RNase H-like nuclease (RuvC/YqgF family)
MTLSSAGATVMIGIPSILVAAATYWLATRAHAETARQHAESERAAGTRADVEALTEGRKTYESVIRELREDNDRLRREITELRARVETLEAELAGLRDQG